MPSESRCNEALIGTASVLIFILVVSIYIFKRCTRPRILPQTGGQPSVNVVTVNSNTNTNNNATSSTMMPMPMAYPPQPMYQYPAMPGPYPHPTYASSPPVAMQPAAQYTQAPPPAYQEIGTHSSPISIPVSQSKQTLENQGVKVLPTA
ncbi:hypothetical protein D918_08371 [Trichuris suis]|nr:hypothetical protein D918_08371 [Trichuris suis]